MLCMLVLASEPTNKSPLFEICAQDKRNLTGYHSCNRKPNLLFFLHVWRKFEFHLPDVRRGLRGVQSKKVQSQQEDRQAAEERIQGGSGEVWVCQTGKQTRCVHCSSDR